MVHGKKKHGEFLSDVLADHPGLDAAAAVRLAEGRELTYADLVALWLNRDRRQHRRVLEQVLAYRLARGGGDLPPEMAASLADGEEEARAAAGAAAGAAKEAEVMRRYRFRG